MLKLGSTISADLKVNGTFELTASGALKAFVTHPGFAAVSRYRAYSKWYPHVGIKRFIARLLWLHNIRKAGCYIGPYCEIGEGLSLPHATGIVIGDHVKIGNGVKIYQNVTIGRRDDESEACPQIEDEVCIYAGACVLGNIRVGRAAIIGANAVVLDDVPAGAVVVGAPARVVKSNCERLAS